MKLLLIVLLSIKPSLLLAQSNYREATSDERNILMPKGEEEKLKELGREVAKNNEIILVEAALLENLVKNGDLNTDQKNEYLQKLTNLGLSKDTIRGRVENLSNQYFARLQINKSEEVLPKSDQEAFEKKFNSLEAQFEEDQSNQQALDTELSNLVERIESSPVTKENQNKAEQFKKSMLTLANDNTYVAKPQITDEKMFTPVKIMVPADFSIAQNDSKSTTCVSCINNISENDKKVSDLNLQIEEITKKSEKKPFLHQIYFSWGYNRNYHSKTDVKFKTNDGTFVIHDAVGKDRPSAFDLKTYFNPADLSIPQYNVEIGVMFNPKWGLEVKQDHMKFIFDNKRPYEISGDYNRKVIIKNDNPTNEWDQSIPVDFAEAKAKKDATWLGFEHSDGYNYVSLGAVYNQNLFQTKNKNFTVDARLGAGAGLMIPKTKVMFHQDKQWNWEGLDNKFHVAGGGVHGEAKLRFTFWKSIYLQAATRGTYIKVADALVNDKGARMEHIQPIGSIQIMGQIGYVHTFSQKKKDSKKTKKRN